MKTEIGNLVLLKFLGLSEHQEPSSYFTDKPLKVPRTIGRLKNLQTLCVTEIYWNHIPREMSGLKELRHVIFGKCNLYIESYQMKLQTLRNIWYEDWIKNDIVNFTSLRGLYIQGRGAHLI